MVFDPLSLITIPFTWVADKVLKRTVNKRSKYISSKKAMRGDALCEQGDFTYLVKIELLNLSKSRSLPAELQSQQCRDWLRIEKNVQLFAKVFWAKWAQRRDILKSVEEQLAINYEQNTGEIRKLASGRVRLAIDFIYGQLTATDDRRHTLQTALMQYSAGQVFSLTHNGPPSTPGDEDLQHFRVMAQKMIDAGNHIWRLPKVVVPLSLEIHDQDDKVHSTSASELVSEVEAGKNLVLHGSAGMGKTTLALKLCLECLESGKCIPLYVDVAAWGSKKLGLFDYIATLPAAISNGITSAMLTKLAEKGKLTIVLNGWNEIPPKSKGECGRGLAELIITAEALNIVVVSRSDKDIPSLKNSKKIVVQGLSWKGQQKLVREELEENLAESLLDLLGRNNHLRYSARSPLILRGLISYLKMGGTAENICDYDLLNASVESFETDVQRNTVLSTEPIDCNQTVYLERLACFLTEQQTTTCSRKDALKIFSSAAKQLQGQGQISVLPNLTAILDVLSNHHLLHLDSDTVRFAHQRFQEYFAAKKLLNDSLDSGSSSVFLRDAMNKISWDDSLELVADKLRGDGINALARVKLIEIAKDIDLGLACDLIRISAFERKDDAVLHDWIAGHVNALVGSPTDELRDLGTAYQIASCLPVFADHLWALLEDANHQNRLKTYRLNSTEISILQLGDEAEMRIDAWPLDRRVEFINETAKHPDNYEYIVKLARFESIPEIRSAAVAIFPWEYPASEVPIKSLFEAPIEVLTDRNVISCIQYYSELGDDVKEVLERIKSFSTDEIPSGVQVELSLAFPDEFGAIYQDAVLERLADQERYMHDDDLLTIAQTYFPERMLDVAKELAFAKKPHSPQDHILRYQPFPPTWVGTCLQKMSSDIKHIIFQKMLDYLSQGKDINFLDGKIIGPLASSYQIKKCLDFLTREDGKEYGEISDKDRLRYKKIEEILINAEGDDLLEVVRKFGRESSYDEAALMLKFLNLRIKSDDPAGVIKEWLPTIDDVDALILLFAEKEETAEDPQNLVRIHLCSIASHVDPHQYMPFIIECCQLHLDIWNVYRERMSKWAKERMGRRPQNSMYSEDLKSALARCGRNALPDLLKFLNHSEAMEIVIGSMVRIVNEPWSSKKEIIWPGVSSVIQEGNERRKQGLVNKQPEEALQPLTDQVAKELGRKLTKTVAEYLEQRNHKNQFYPIGHLAALLAGISSPEIIEPIDLALASGLMSVYHSVNAIEALIRQGLFLNDKEVITHLEELYENSEGKDWYSDHERYEMISLIRLLLSVEQIDQLNKPVEYYLEKWKHFSSTSEIIQGIGSINPEAAWEILANLESEIIESGRLSKEYAEAIANVLTKRNLTDFFAKLTDGSFFGWCSDSWELKRIAPHLINLLEEDPPLVEDFTVICRDVRSPSADALAVEVLSKIEGADRLLHQCLIDSVDDGRAVDGNMPAFYAIISLFKLNIPAGSGSYEITQRANNDIRRKLFTRAKGSGKVANGCKHLLAHVELKRRESGRPIDELRHPAPEESTCWDDVLIHDETL